MVVAKEMSRATYQWLIDLYNDSYLNDILRFLCVREIIHLQRFIEAIEMITDDFG